MGGNQELPALCAAWLASGLLRRCDPENDEVGSVSYRAVLRSGNPTPSSCGLSGLADAHATFHIAPATQILLDKIFKFI
jgi:hypothetical protein